ncbi:MAG TPA: GFA family protein [Xanthobacteraceae bacterium]|jgi:hypothetical protein|nr:GFA family protein [Xanthobacteraceae bacterium]
MKVDGACACGAIKVEAEADPEKTQLCHCTDCQTATGTAFRVSVPVPVPGASLKLSGIPATYLKTTADSGNPRLQGFCGTCGTPLYSTTPGEGVQQMYVLRVGILRQRDQFAPRKQIWTRSARNWLPQLDSVPRFEKQS